MHNKFNENNENNPTNKYIINDKPEAIETKNLKINNQSSLKSNNNIKPKRNGIVNRLPSSLKIKSKRMNDDSPYKSNIKIWESKSKKPIIKFIIDNVPNIIRENINLDKISKCKK